MRDVPLGAARWGLRSAVATLTPHLLAREQRYRGRLYDDSLCFLRDVHASYIWNLGYWGPDVATVRQAQVRLVELCADHLALDGHRVLDVGCGVGGAMAHLAQRHPQCSFDGVTISAEEAARSVPVLDELGCGARVRVLVGDAQRLDLPDRYDRILSLESAFHYRDKAAFLAAAHRVLTPGGRLVVADVTASRSSVTSRATRWLGNQLGKCHMVAMDDWRSLARQSPFERASTELELTRGVLPFFSGTHIPFRWRYRDTFARLAWLWAMMRLGHVRYVLWSFDKR